MLLWDSHASHPLSALLLSAAASSYAAHHSPSLAAIDQACRHGLLGHQDLVRQGVQEESCWPALLHHHPVRLSFPHRLLNKQPPKCPSRKLTAQTPLAGNTLCERSGRGPPSRGQSAWLQKLHALVQWMWTSPGQTAFLQLCLSHGTRGEVWPHSSSVLKAHPASKSIMGKQVVVAALGHSIVIRQQYFPAPVWSNPFSHSGLFFQDQSDAQSPAQIALYIWKKIPPRGHMPMLHSLTGYNVQISHQSVPTSHWTRFCYLTAGAFPEPETMPATSWRPVLCSLHVASSPLLTAGLRNRKMGKSRVVLFCRKIILVSSLPFGLFLFHGAIRNK